MLATQLIEPLLIERAVIPKTLHLRLKPVGIEISEHIHQSIQFLLVLCPCKRLKYHHLRFIHRIYLHTHYGFTAQIYEYFPKRASISGIIYNEEGKWLLLFLV